MLRELVQSMDKSSQIRNLSLLTFIHPVAALFNFRTMTRHSIWHRSGPNRTANPRRVFYAQYSTNVVRAAPSDPRPLSLAVPCCLEPLSSNAATLRAAEQLEAPGFLDETAALVDGSAADVCSTRAREMEGAGVDARSAPLRGARRGCPEVEVSREMGESISWRTNGSKRVRETEDDDV